MHLAGSDIAYPLFAMWKGEGNMNEEYLEMECDAPEDWEENAIFQRDGIGIVIEAVIPDDVNDEVTENAFDD